MPRMKLTLTVECDVPSVEAYSGLSGGVEVLNFTKRMEYERSICEKAPADYLDMISGCLNSVITVSVEKVEQSEEESDTGGGLSLTSEKLSETVGDDNLIAVL